MFRNAKTYKTGLSDFYKIVVSIMRLSYKKRPQCMIKYRGYKKFSNEPFKSSLNELNLVQDNYNKEVENYLQVSDKNRQFLKVRSHFY